MTNDIRKKIQQAVDEVNKEKHTNYELGEYIGEGGFTYTYELKNPGREGDFVLKVTPWKGYERDVWDSIVFKKDKEIELLSSANVQFVSRIYDSYHCFGDDSLPECILTIERRLLPIEEYFKAVGEQIPMSSNYLAAKLLKELAQGLVYIHNDLDTMHRDIKDKNFAYNPQTGRLSYIDFSISKGECTDIDSITLIPAASYMFSAPEYFFSMRSGYELQKKEHYTKQMDIYSLGACMFYFVTGKYTVDYISDSAEYIEKSYGEKQKLLKDSSVSPLVQEIILRMIDEDPEDRYQTANNLLDVIMDLYELKEKNETLKVETEKLNKNFSSKVKHDKEHIDNLEKEQVELREKNKKVSSEVSELKERSNKYRKEGLKAKRRAEELESEHAHLNNRISKQDKQIENLKDERWNGIMANMTWLLVPASNVACLYVLTSIIITPLPGAEFIETLFDTWERQYAVWICMWITFFISMLLLTYVIGGDLFKAVVIAGVIATLGCLYPTAFGGIGMIEDYEFTGDIFVKDGYKIEPTVKPMFFKNASHETDYFSYDYKVVDDTIIVNEDAKDKAFAVGTVRFTNNSGTWASSGFIVDNTKNVKPQKVAVNYGEVTVSTGKVKKNSSDTVVVGKIGAEGLRIKKKQNLQVTVYAVKTDGTVQTVGCQNVKTNKKGDFVLVFEKKLNSVKYLNVEIQGDCLENIKTADVWLEAICE